MEQFDYIIAGGGAAGLGLAIQLSQSALKDRSILIIDKDAKDRNDRTWCFWSESPTLYDPILYRSWDRIRFVGQDFDRTIPLGSFRYNMIRGIDFYRFARQVLSSHPNVTTIQGAVEEIRDGEDRGWVRVDGQEHSGSWIFDSLLRPQDVFIDPQKYHSVKQHFLGWELETDRDVFNPQVPVLFDFRTPQFQEMRFLYILPFSPRQALVEYTLFSADLLSQAEYEAGLRQYLHEVLGLKDYRVLSAESGIIPMTDRPFPRRLGRRILAIGTKGGRVKSSSGYAFLRMVQDASAIVRSLERTGTPFDLPRPPARYHFYDRIMLQLMQRQGEKMKRIFTEMFKNNPPGRIFHFLDEDESLWQDIRLMASLPVWPFFSAMLKVYLLHKI